MLFGLNEAALTAGVAGLLWALSISSWVVIVYKTWWVWRMAQDVPAAQQAYWLTPNPVQAHQALAVLDRHGLLQSMTALATTAPATASVRAPSVLTQQTDGLDDPGGRDNLPATHRQVVQALRRACQQVQWGQPWLACVATVAPFLGLLGTVWGLLGALAALPGSTPDAWEDCVPALTQALHLTAVGLCVAVPALLAHHLLAPRLSALQQSLEDFASDLIEHLYAGRSE
jgi:biopolymer transport protein ExbB